MLGQDGSGRPSRRVLPNLLTGRSERRMRQRQPERLRNDLGRRGRAEELAPPAGGPAGLAAEFPGILEREFAVRESRADRLDLASVLSRP